ncbi:arsenosugar biosynthesis radical SAM protein ArsS [bacterium]|nr:arsenosugar biosynthesis radical SAM protein ArsS [bacterium]
MNDFERRIGRGNDEGLWCREIRTVQVNVGLRCNQRCAHCHVDASPERTEMMDWPTLQQVLAACQAADCGLVDITGGAPELNPHFRRFVSALRQEGFPVQVRTNLTVFSEPGMESTPQFLRDQQVGLVASMPCYLAENVRAQRGAGVYERSLNGIRRLNALGYGARPELPLDLIYNPGGPFLPPEQGELEADYRRELRERFGVTFSRLLTITNMPIGRFQASLRQQGRDGEYLELLKDALNPQTVENLMCRRQVSIGWDGALYDCDFNLALGLRVNHGAPDHIRRFDPLGLAERRIVTGDHCFGCTAGSGSSCGGALV